MPRSRRGRGEHSVFWSESKQIWIAKSSFSLPGGKRVRREAYGHNKLEAIAKLAKMGGVQPAPGQAQNLGAFLLDWLASMRGQVRDTTHDRYRLCVEYQITPHLGRMALPTVTPHHVQCWVDEMRKTCSPRQTQMAFVVLRQALTSAVNWQKLAANPCAAIKRPSVPQKSVAVLTADQARALLDAAKATPHYLLFRVAVTTGMRQGELFGLQWDDVDLSHRQIAVRHSLEELRGKLTLSTTKTGRARVVQVDAGTIKMLRAVRQPSGYVFLSPRGTPWRKSSFSRRYWIPLMAKAGVPRIRFHDLRHTSATLLLADGVSPKVIQERLGHSSIRTTLDVYAHAVPTMQADAATRMGRIVS